MSLSKQGDYMTTSLSQSFKSEGARMNNPAFKKNQPKESSMKTNNKGAQMNQAYFDEKVYQYLTNKYNKLALTKAELAVELGISVSSINQYICQGKGLPSYLRVVNGKNTRIVFPLNNIVSYISNTVKVA